MKIFLFCYIWILLFITENVFSKACGEDKRVFSLLPNYCISLWMPITWFALPRSRSAILPRTALYPTEENEGRKGTNSSINFKWMLIIQQAPKDALTSKTFSWLGSKINSKLSFHTGFMSLLKCLVLFLLSGVEEMKSST